MKQEQGQKLAIMGVLSIPAAAETAVLATHLGGPGLIGGLALGAAAYLVADDFRQKRQANKGESQSSSLVSSKIEPEKPSIAYRLFNGKSVREAHKRGDDQTEKRDKPEPSTNEHEEMEALQPKPLPSLPHQDKSELATPRKKPSGAFLFSDVLTSFTPSLNKIYLGTLEDGTMVYCKAEELCHVALAGATRGGKSSIMRMLMAQLCYAGANVLLLNPHYSRYLLDKKEDWTPFEPYLMYDPMECRKYEVIEHYLKQVATELLPKRLEKFAHSLPVGRPYFLILDELPAIVDHLPDAPMYLKAILREGAKVGLFLITAAQDFLVSTIFPGGGGAVRDCYRTVAYVGGDGTTAKVLLDMAARDVPENKLGKGTIMLRCDVVRPAAIARVPLVDNDSLYASLGPSTYTPSRESHDEDDGLLNYMVSGGNYEQEERQTDALPATTRRHVAMSAQEARRRQLEARRRAVYARQEERERVVATVPVAGANSLPAELQRAYEAFESQMSYRDLGDRLGVSKDTAGKWYKRLQDLGYITANGIKTV